MNKETQREAQEYKRRERKEVESKMIKAVLFDMDGVIADTEPLHAKARDSLLLELGLEVEKISARAIGRSKRTFWGEIVEEFSINITADTLTRREFEILIRIIEESKLKPTKGLEDVLQKMQEKQIKALVASSSDRNYVEAVLQTTKLNKYFSACVCGDEVKQAKPAPDIYLKALAESGAEKSEVLAVEDSDTGAAAAYAAGIDCVAYDAVEDVSLKQRFLTCKYKITQMCELADLL